MTWTNLGLFYAYYGDTEIAKESLNKAQVLDPDYSLAWIGQAIIAAAVGEYAQASALFEHAVTLLTSIVRQSMNAEKLILTSFYPARGGPHVCKRYV